MNKLVRKGLFWYGHLWPIKRVKPPYKHISQIGDPILRNRAEFVPIVAIKSKEIENIILAMKSAMKEYECAGIAAPQIGINKRIIAVELKKSQLEHWSEVEIKKNQITEIPQMVIINPVMKVLNMNKVSLNEACESIKGYTAAVPRYKEVLVDGYDEEGKEISVNFGGWASRIIQHEIDHLDGKLYTDIMDRSTFCCALWKEVNKHGGRIKLPFTPV